jgi:hypothetical protein
MINSWVDALTIRTFNEELKGVFPYIYKLVSEKREGELNYDDLVAEETECGECGNNPCSCDDETAVKEHSMFNEFEQSIDDLATLEYEQQPEEVAEEPAADPTAVKLMVKFLTDQINSWSSDLEDPDVDPEDIRYTEDVPKMKEHLQKLSSGNATEKDIVDALYDYDTEFSEIIIESLQSSSPKLYAYIDQLSGKFGYSEDVTKGATSEITEEVMEFIASMYDREAGTFPRGEEGVKIAVEKKFGEQASQFADYVVEKLSVKSQGTVQEQPVEQAIEQPVVDSSNNELLRIRQLSGF